MVLTNVSKKEILVRHAEPLRSLLDESSGCFFGAESQYSRVRKAMLDCGPGPTTVGLLDSMRIELDLAHLTWDQYAKNFNSNAPAMAKRYYFHKRTWLNDADHLGLALLTLSQGQAAATLIALSGGTMISGDRLYELDPARLEILKKVLPTYGEAARQLDLFEKDLPEIFALKIRKDLDEWWLVGIFNWDESATVIRDLNLARLGLDAQKTYLVTNSGLNNLLPKRTVPSG